MLTVIIVDLLSFAAGRTRCGPASFRYFELGIGLPDTDGRVGTEGAIRHGTQVTMQGSEGSASAKSRNNDSGL